jgi:hypothetical protein
VSDFASFPKRLAPPLSVTAKKLFIDYQALFTSQISFTYQKTFSIEESSSYKHFNMAGLLGGGKQGGGLLSGYDFPYSLPSPFSNNPSNTA